MANKFRFIFGALLFFGLLSMNTAADTTTVQSIDWERFSKKVKPESSYELSAKINANAARFAHSWAIGFFQSSANDDRFVLENKNLEHSIRPATSAAVGLAVAVRTNISPRYLDIGNAELIHTTKKLIKGSAAIHKVNGGAWGYHWQSSLWAAQLGRAAWLIWDELDKQTQQWVVKIIVAEADRHIRSDYKVPYWNGVGGDSKAEENSWESMVLQQAIAMLPKHKNVNAWKLVCDELLISAYSVEKDMDRSETSYNGKTPKQWLKGYNVREDGIVINHNLVHNDYMASIAHLQMSGLIIFSLAGIPAPETVDFNFELIYNTLATKKFTSPPWQAPGGTMFVPGKAEQYYPQGTDWSPLRFASFYGMDALAELFSYDSKLDYKAKNWRKLRGEKILEMQSRFRDGRMYANGEYTRYPFREQMVFWMMSDAHMLQWLADRNALAEKANWYK